MNYGICICGLNGSGKTTLAHALSKELNFKHMDIEDYYFTSSDKPYSTQRTREQVEQLLLEDIVKNPCFVFSAVNGNMNASINYFYNLVAYIEAPVEIRIKRIRQRSIDKFGDRVLAGGDMHEQEEKFYKFASDRQPTLIEEWLNTLSCKVLHLDGTKDINRNIQKIIAETKLRKASLV